MIDEESVAEETLADEEEGEAEEGKPARRKAKYKGIKLAPPTEADWQNVREMYEMGGYTQRHLADMCRARGVAISQSAISRRIIAEDWLKASIMERIRKEVQESQISQIGEGLRSMLEQHSQQSQIAISEVLQHFRKSADIRKTDPNYTMPPQTLAAVVQTLKTAQEMQARSTGWNYKEGRPFRPDTETEQNRVQKLEVGVLSPAEEDSIRAELEKIAVADGEGEGE